MSEEYAQPPAGGTRRLAAIMFTDIVGFSRQMGANETHTFHLLEVHNQLLQQTTTAHHGKVIKTIGDAFLVDFASVVDAVQCAQQIQDKLRTYNAEQTAEDQIHLRIGIHLGDIMQKDGDVFGDGVNIAKRLQELTEPDTICLSQKVHEEVVKKIDLGTVVSLGRPKLKNIAERFQIYALLAEPPQGLHQKLQVQQLKLSRRLRPAHRMALAGVVLVAVTALAVRHFLVSPLSPQDSAALPLPDKPSIAVMPFANLSSDPNQDYFSKGMTEDITADLSKIPDLFVISSYTTTSLPKDKPIQEVSKELGVRYVLVGGVRKSDDQVRISAQLIDGTTGGHLWSERYDRPLKDIFVVQDEIRQKIVTTLKLQFTLWKEGVLVRKTTDNLEAYDFYLRGTESMWRAYYGTQKEANIQARQLLEKAIELDPMYAEAYVGLGGTYLSKGVYYWSPDRAQSFERAIELLQKAIALDDSLPLAHQFLSNVYVWGKKQHDHALAEAQKAVALAPNDANAQQNLGVILAWSGRPEEAIGIIEKAMRLNPKYPPQYLQSLNLAYRLAGRYEEAIAPAKKILVLNPNFMPAHLQLASCYAHLGRLEEARAEATEVMRLLPNYSLEIARQNLPIKDPAILEREIDVLRKAGLK